MKISSSLERLNYFQPFEDGYFVPSLWFERELYPPDKFKEFYPLIAKCEYIDTIFNEPYIEDYLYGFILAVNPDNPKLIPEESGIIFEGESFLHFGICSEDASLVQKNSCEAKEVQLIIEYTLSGMPLIAKKLAILQEWLINAKYWRGCSIEYEKEGDEYPDDGWNYSLSSEPLQKWFEKNIKILNEDKTTGNIWLKKQIQKRIPSSMLDDYLTNRRIIISTLKDTKMIFKEGKDLFNEWIALGEMLSTK